MKHVVLLVAILSPFVLCAQISIGDSDMPSAGDTMRYRTTTITDFTGDDTGPAYEWHFETLAPQTEMADTAVSVGSTPLLYQFFFNNPFIYPDWNADYAVRGQGIDFQAVQIEDVYDYFKKDGDGFRNVGFGATVNSLPASVRRDPIDRIYQFPLDYGNTDSSASEFLIAIDGLGAYGQNQLRSNEVDGWGTLYLPADTFEVLRVKSVLQRTDTIYIEQFGFGLAFPEPETIEYKWLAIGMDQPVLQVTTLADIPTLVRFVYDLEDFSTSVSPLSGITGLALYPNPATDRVRVTVDGAGTIELLDAQGRIASVVAVTMGQREVVVDVSGLVPGVYAVRRAGGVAATRLVIAR